MSFKIDYVNPSQVFKQAKDYIPERILSNGRLVAEFEEKAAEFLGAKYAVATCSCTIALYCIWEILGISGKKVLVPSFTWRSTVDAIRMAGGIPVLGDILSDTLCLKANEENREVSAICPVDVFGVPADYESIEKLGIPYVVDSAHSFGAYYKMTPIGRYGIHAFSLSPTKVLISNEGGLVTCNDANLATELKDVRRWAGRMTEYNASCALEGLKNLPNVIAEKQRIAQNYRRFAVKQGWNTQTIEASSLSTFKDVILILNSSKERDSLKQHLENDGIETRIYFVPAHTLKSYINSEKRKLENTNDIFSRSICIPSWVGIDQDYVINSMREFVLKRKEA